MAASPSPWRRRLVGGALLLLVAGCKSPSEWRVEADREVYGALDVRRTHVPEVEGSLDLDGADQRGAAVRALGKVVLDFEESLRIAAAGSREYRNRREDAYLVALRYTEARWNFDTQYGLGAGVEGAASEGESTGGATADGSVSRNLERGGAIVLRLANDFLTAFTGDPVETAQSILSLDLFLPLVKGSGTAARETLTQAERDVLYALRSYARYQQDFVVRVARLFYGVVEARDTLKNEEVTYDNLVQLYERAKSFGPEGAGRMPDFEVDQARQNVLRADQRRVLAKSDLERTLDDLRLELGLPFSTEVVVAADALEGLRAHPREAPAGEVPGSVATALERRLDLLNARDQYEDALRKVVVAANGLGPQVDLRLGAELVGADRRPYDLADARATVVGGFSVDLPIDIVPERNAYRQALIFAQRAHRAVEGLEDDVTAEVREAWRSLVRAKTSYGIQDEGVRLAERRVESARLNLQAGKAEVRDVLEAESALIEARNALTRALVEQTLARLELLRDMGTLRWEDATL